MFLLTARRFHASGVEEASKYQSFELGGTEGLSRTMQIIRWGLIFPWGVEAAAQASGGVIRCALVPLGAPWTRL